MSLSEDESIQPQGISDAIHLVNQLGDEDLLGLPNDQIQLLLASALKMYAAKSRTETFEPLPEGDVVSATDIATVVVRLLEAADIEIFELGMWKLWGNV